MKKFTVLLSLVVLSACSSDDKAAATPDASIITENDFESLAGWNTDPTALYRGKAHSGRYALKVDKDHEYSTSFDMALSQVAPTRVKGVHLEAWVLRPSDQSTGVLGLQVMEPETNVQVYSDGIRLAEVVKTYNKWEKVEADYELPATITPTQHLRLSLWRANSTDLVLVDDVKMTIK